MQEVEYIVSDVIKIPVPFVYVSLIKGQGYKIRATIATTAAEHTTLEQQAAQNNPAQIALAHAAGTP